MSWFTGPAHQRQQPPARTHSCEEWRLSISAVWVYGESCTDMACCLAPCWLVCVVVCVAMLAVAWLVFAVRVLVRGEVASSCGVCQRVGPTQGEGQTSAAKKPLASSVAQSLMPAGQNVLQTRCCLSLLLVACAPY